MFAAGPYGRLLRLPQVRQLVMSSVIGRIPVGLSTLALVLFLQGQADSLADAGIAAACYVLGLAAMAPVIGRAVDRAGPRRVLLACIALHPIALVGLTAIALAEARHGWVFAAALISGASLPPITVCVRALYPRLVTDAALQRTAYSLDSAIIETVFILGPILAAGFAAAGAQVGAIWLSAACALGGGLLFLDADPVRAWRPRNAGLAPAGASPLRVGHVRGLLAAAALFAFAFGAFEIGVVGFATRQGMPAAAGVILALASVGSVLGVLAYGGRSWSLDAGRQFLVLLALMAGGLAALAPIQNVPLFAAAVVVAAAPMAPVIAANSVLVLRTAPKERIAEAFTWASTALLAGISAGTAAGGTLVERYSPTVALLAASAATLLAAVTAYPAARRIARPEPLEKSR
jgi:predicted MFS family arabinose efflux permease